MKKICSVGDCHNKYYAKWYCQKHYQRLTRWVIRSVKDRKWHHWRSLDKLWENVDKDWPIIEYVWTPCWLWKWHTTNGWYGIITINNKWIRTHCLSWEIHNKQKIPKWMHTCHKCDNPSCINPEHLFLWTPKENAQDKVKKWRAYSWDHKWEKSWRAKLKESDILKIRIDTRKYLEIANEYKIDTSSVSDIKRKKTWKHL
jgi:hypothetical protein